MLGIPNPHQRFPNAQRWASVPDPVDVRPTCGGQVSPTPITVHLTREGHASPTIIRIRPTCGGRASSGPVSICPTRGGRMFVTLVGVRLTRKVDKEGDFTLHPLEDSKEHSFLSYPVQKAIHHSLVRGDFWLINHIFTSFTRYKKILGRASMRLLQIPIPILSLPSHQAHNLSNPFSSQSAHTSIDGNITRTSGTWDNFLRSSSVCIWRRLALRRRLSRGAAPSNRSEERATEHDQEQTSARDYSGGSRRGRDVM
ncbi:hypothetical protein GW17_00023817 [Ensete ventricosum]|nr:hypothetical protein GW17_00023817 [Ensete ventricosum]RZR86499.1 hypothetical protein BHM03_00013701 [Ensete ventricosum]